jgi:hypothetical protein
MIATTSHTCDNFIGAPLRMKMPKCYLGNPKDNKLPETKYFTFFEGAKRNKVVLMEYERWDGYWSQ